MAATFIFPTVHRVTSGFRTPNRKSHHGTDFAQSGYHEIKAVAAGEVVKSYTSSSYGECIIIRHKINGQTWESLYAHMRGGSRKVKVGDTVKQGQVIGVMGNTGDSTGQHLHFELHKGTWNINKSNAVDPLDYLGLDLKAVPETKVKGVTNSNSGKYGKLKIVNVKNAAIVMDKPDRINAKNIGTIAKGKTVPLNGSVRGKNSESGYWEIEFNGSLGYITGKYGERV